ncbi:MAG: FG-GAP-like repeat-containing protein, partial [Candidatus Contendobacter sp.]
MTTFGVTDLAVGLPYNPSQVGSWTITAINGPDTTTHVTNDVAGVQALPVVSTINLSGSLLAPALTWVLPVTNVPYTRIRVRIQAGEAIVFTSSFLPVNTTTYTLPSGVLQLDRDYILRVMLEEGRNGNLVNRSDARVTYTTLANLLAGLTSDGQIYYTPDLNTWVNIPGQLAQLQVGHFNGDGQADLAGLASNGSIWYTTNLSTWTQVPGGLAQLRAGDFNGDGHADLAGLAGDGSVWYTTDLIAWTNIPGQLAQLRVGDFNGDGHADLAGLASNGSIWYTTNFSTWTQVPGGLAQLRVGDFNGDGHADLAGLASNGSIWYATDLATWT